MVDQVFEHELVMRIHVPAFGVSDKVPHKLGCTAMEDGYRLKILDLGSRGITMQLICDFVFSKCKKQGFSRCIELIHCSNNEKIVYLC